ncbi:ABC transporter permease subunit [Phytoactinopolyspora halotolerans]|uniref:ABC transporter permease n=1 Tax=Phytoactinopolyspora halotolerans TaxID=1981512 RepID=A0A6L9SGE2_9ACTN|nr:ABC transporter permease subunit [Phytoactinopolyspora halotolerans]NEE03714.1 hypothetical protein [Phytoactinopolyspora halotolerans]
MINAFASETLLLRRRPMPLVVGGAWTIMVLAFAFGVPYIVYSVLDPATEQADRAELLDTLIPASVPATSASSYPLFGGALMLILGVLMTGPEFRWNTWTARFTQGPSRTDVILAKIAVGAVATFVIAVIVAAASTLASFIIALVEGAPTGLPSAADLVASVGAATLISTAWMSVGAALGVVFRGTTVALAVGLLWTLGLENAISGLAGMLSALEPVRAVMLGTASGSLVSSLGAPTQGEGGTPGVVDDLSTSAACVVLVAYAVISTVVALAVSRRRDIT